jgi:hypothetical protein
LSCSLAIWRPPSAASAGILTARDPVGNRINARPCWTDERNRLLIEAADALHDSADIGEDLWRRLAGLFSEEQLLDLLMLAGWYQAISFTANGARVACEDGAPRFADVRRSPGRSGTTGRPETGP